MRQFLLFLLAGFMPFLCLASDEIILISSGQTPNFGGIGPDLVEDQPPIKIAGKNLVAYNLEGQVVGFANGFEIELITKIILDSGKTVKLIQIPLSGNQDHTVVKLLLQNPSQLRELLVQKNLMRPDQDVVVASAVAASAARIQAGWIFTPEPHYFSPKVFYSHVARSETQNGLNEQKMVIQTPSGKPVQIPSVQTEATVVTRTGNLWTILLILYGLDPIQYKDIKEVKVGKLTLRADENPAAYFESNKDSIYMNGFGSKVGKNDKNLFVVGDPVDPPGAEPGIAVAGSTKQRSEQLVKMIESGVAKAFEGEYAKDLGSRYRVYPSRKSVSNQCKTKVSAK